MHRKFLEEYGKNLTVIASEIWGEVESHFCAYPFTLLNVLMYFQLVGIFFKSQIQERVELWKLQTNLTRLSC